MKKSSFILYTEYKEHIDLLSVEEKGKLLDAIFDYAEGKEVNLDGMARMAFSFIKAQMDRDTKKYEGECEKKKVAGSLGGLAKARNAKQNVADVAGAKCAKQSVANVADNDNDNEDDNDNDNVNDNVTDNDKKSRAKAPRSFVPPTLDEVKDYCWERNNGIDAQRFVDFYESKGWMIGRNKMKDWKAAVRNWEQRSRDKPASNVVNAADDFFADIKGAMNGL